MAYRVITGVSTRITPDMKKPRGDRVVSQKDVKAVAGEKRHKFRARRVTVDGITFDSGKEARRWQELNSLLVAGAIQDLQRQVPFKWECRCFANGRECNSLLRRRQETYICDFVYKQDGKTIYEDVKGYRTKAYKRKKRIVEYLYGIVITET